VSELEKLSHIHNINYSERYQMNLTIKIENLVYTRCGILEIFKKTGLVKEALGILFDLTHL
jgi:hypothetical protein